MKYAIQVWFDNDWQYVTTGSSVNQLTPLLFNNSVDAEDIAEKWRLSGKEEFVKVVLYTHSQ